MRGVIHHLDLTVRDPERVFAFYDTVLTALGYRLERKKRARVRLESSIRRWARTRSAS